MLSPQEAAVQVVCLKLRHCRGSCCVTSLVTFHRKLGSVRAQGPVTVSRPLHRRRCSCPSSSCYRHRSTRRSSSPSLRSVRTVPSPQRARAQTFMQPSVLSRLPSSFLIALGTLGEIGAQDPVAAARGDTLVGAGVRVRVVAIVTGFITLVPGAKSVRRMLSPHVAATQFVRQASSASWLPSSQAS